MIQPNVAEQLLGLAKISGEEKVDVPVSEVRRNLLMVKMVDEALKRGVTWSAIGTVLVGKADGKAAKKAAKALARETQRELLRRGNDLD